MDFVVKNIFKTRVRKGVDAKLLQYDMNAKVIDDRQIGIVDIIETHLIKEKVGQNCVMINLEKDGDRYANTVKELGKLSIDKFIHLKGTWWRNKDQMEKDLTLIVEFLKQFNPQIESKEIKINEFSEINDKNIKIQDGPLGCFCSHLRAMIYGYLNFDKYTIVVEDDISITNTENISKYLKYIPDDWDIVCLGAIGKDKIYEEPYHKFTTEFHSTHFYIINHKCMERLFQHMYPINDQVDVLIAELIHELNIYNISDTIYQKCISTNTQNNLNTIFNARYYDVLREQIDKIKESCIFFANLFLPNNDDRNRIIVSNLLYDILYSYITDSGQGQGLIDDKNKDESDYISEFKDYDEYNQMFYSMAYFIQCAKKAINVPTVTTNLMNDIFGIFRSFKLHNTLDNELNIYIKAYSYGATSQTYISDDKSVIIKAYNNKLRWTVDGHNNSTEIFQRELSILQKGLICLPKLISFNIDNKIIKMQYHGESLYNNFNLPIDWKEQITNIFNMFDENGIFYPEFKIHNILVLDGKLTFVDYGLASFINKKVNNSENCKKFIEYISLLSNKFSNILTDEQRYQLYSTFVQNMKINNKYHQLQ